MNKKPPTKFKTTNTEFDLSQTVHPDNQHWRKHLVLVSSLPNRFVGLVDEEITAGKPFKLYATLMYVAELMFSPVVEMQETANGPRPVMGPNGQPKIVGMQGGTKLHALVPYDFIGTPTIEIGVCQHIIRVADQDHDFQQWMYREYQNFFDHPKVVSVR